jgi:hypothetical protein
MYRYEVRAFQAMKIERAIQCSCWKWAEKGIPLNRSPSFYSWTHLDLSSIVILFYPPVCSTQSSLIMEERDEMFFVLSSLVWGLVLNSLPMIQLPPDSNSTCRHTCCWIYQCVGSRLGGLCGVSEQYLNLFWWIHSPRLTLLKYLVSITVIIVCPLNHLPTIYA